MNLYDQFTSKLKKARNIENIYNRINRTKNTIVSKKDKSEDFNGTLNILVGAVGGDKDKSSCANSSLILARAVSDTLTTLDSCKGDIEDSCVFNSTALDDFKTCAETAANFSLQVDLCFRKSDMTEKCNCSSALDPQSVDDIVACDVTKLTSEDKTTKTQRNGCKNRVIKCKNEEKESINYVDQCKAQLKCGGAGSKEEGEELLQTLTPLRDALQNPAFVDAMKELGLDTGTGSDGVLPNNTGSGGRRYRHRRQAQDPECTQIRNDWEAFNTTADSAVSGVSGDVNDSLVSAATDALNKINENANLKSGLEKCSAARQGSVIADIVYIRFYYFWSQFFLDFVVEARMF